MIFYVIGNGFNQHYGLNTNYSAFKTYLKSIDRDVVERVDDLFYRYNTLHDPSEIENWSKLEDMLEVFSRLNGDEILEEALSNAESDDE